MPTYEYVCEKCGHTFEQVQSISAKPLEICPKDRCARKTWAKGKVKRVIGGGAGIIFKGSGFYITDYRSEKYKEAAKKESSQASSKPAASSDKPAAKAESKPSTPKPKT